MGISQQIGASSLSKPGVCTSTTRPATPYEGQMIYETDTDKVLVYNGSAWYANWNLPFGIVAKGTSTSTTGLTTTETTQITASTFTAITNRYYKITYYEPSVVPAAGATNYALQNIRLTNAAGTQYANGQNQLSGASATGISITVVTIQTLTAGSTVIVGTLVLNGGTGNSYRAATSPALLLVEDIGPV